MINHIDKMADALVDVLKYSDSTVEWVEADDMKRDDGVQAEWFYPALEGNCFSEITAILQYTQQQGMFDEQVGELLLGIALVEMKHYATIRDVVIALGGEMPRQYDSKSVRIGANSSEALQFAVDSEIATIDFYKSLLLKVSADTPTAETARLILNKLIADETLHLKLINAKLLVMLGEHYKAKMGDLLSKVGISI